LKLLRYLKEDVDKELSNIEKNCSQFLKEFKTGRNLFLRVRSDYPQKPNIFVIKGRTDREPKDTPKYIQNKIDEGIERIDACVLGTKEVIISILTSTLTTIAAFSPLILLSSIAGDYIKSLPPMD
jgi:hypothetical protein